MKKTIIFISMVLTLNSCKNDENKNGGASNNDLLCEEVKVQNLVILQNQKNPDLTNGLDKKLLFDTILYGVFDKNLNIYEASYKGEIRKQSSVYDVQMKTESMNDTMIIKDKVTGKNKEFVIEGRVNIDKFYAIMFHEKWEYNGEKNKFIKEPYIWQYVQTFCSRHLNYDCDKYNLQRVFAIKNSGTLNTTKQLLVAKNFKYEFNLKDDYHNYLECFNNDRFIGSIIENALSGKIDVYNPDYLFNKNAQKMDKSVLKEKLDFDRGQIQSVIFDENWYIDVSNLSIYKKINGIALIRQFEDEKKIERKKILFYIPFNE